MAYAIRGTDDITTIDDANIPVNIFITKVEIGDESIPNDLDFVPTHRLTASNFMPRKQLVIDCVHEIWADNISELQELVKKCVLPLYEIAVEKLKNIGNGTDDTLYYWEK